MWKVNIGNTQKPEIHNNVDENKAGDESVHAVSLFERCFFGGVIHSLYKDTRKQPIKCNASI